MKGRRCEWDGRADGRNGFVLFLFSFHFSQLEFGAGMGRTWFLSRASWEKHVAVYDTHTFLLDFCPDVAAWRR